MVQRICDQSLSRKRYDNLDNARIEGVLEGLDSGMTTQEDDR